MIKLTFARALALKKKRISKDWTELLLNPMLQR